MNTQQNVVALARREVRIGGALDRETRQQVTELNQRVIGALLELLAAAAAEPGTEAGTGAGDDGGIAAGAATRAGCDGAAARTVPRVANRIQERAPARVVREESLERPAGLPARCAALPAVAVGARARWLGLGAAGCDALASTPYLLVTVDVAGLLAPRGPGAAAPSRSPPCSPMSPSLPPESSPAAPWSDVARLVVQYAWHLARVAPVLAGFVLGLRAGDVEALRALGLSRVDTLAPAAASCVRLRWPQDLAFWTRWLAAARAGEAAALWACQLRGLQRIAGECWPVSGAI